MAYNKLRYDAFHDIHRKFTGNLYIVYIPVIRVSPMGDPALQTY